MVSQQGCSCCCFLIKFVLTLTALVLVAIYWPFFSQFQPQPYRIPLPFKYNELLSDNNQLDNFVKLGNSKKAKGPCSLIKTDNGILAGSYDGKVVRFLNEEVTDLITINSKCQISSEPGKTCGSISSLRMEENSKTIYFLDSINGLYSATPSNDKIKLNHIVNTSQLSIDCRETKYVQDFVLDKSNQPQVVIYLTDVSGKWDFTQRTIALLEPETKGRLLKIDGATNSVTSVLSNLWTPSGIEITDDRKSLLIAESARRAITRFWLTGDKKGKAETFIDYLPGEPRHIRRSLLEDETYWVTFSNGRSEANAAIADYLSDWPVLRLLLVRMCYAIGSVAEQVGLLSRLVPLQRFGSDFSNGNSGPLRYMIRGRPLVLEINGAGMVVNALQGSRPELSDISEAQEVLDTGRQAGNDAENRLDRQDQRQTRTLIIGSSNPGIDFVAMVSFESKGIPSSLNYRSQPKAVSNKPIM